MLGDLKIREAGLLISLLAQLHLFYSNNKVVAMVSRFVWYKSLKSVMGDYKYLNTMIKKWEKIINIIKKNYLFTKINEKYVECNMVEKKTFCQSEAT